MASHFFLKLSVRPFADLALATCGLTALTGASACQPYELPESWDGGSPPVEIELLDTAGAVASDAAPPGCVGSTCQHACTPPQDSPVTGAELLRDPAFDQCAWTPGWFPATAGSLCIAGQHDRPAAGGRGIYSYSSAAGASVPDFAWQQQAVLLPGGGFGLRASIYLKQSTAQLARGEAFLEVALLDASGSELELYAATMTQDELNAAQAAWIPMELRVLRTPSESASARVRFGVRKTEAGAGQLSASFDDASLTVVE